MEKIKAHLEGDFISSNSQIAFNLQNKSAFGEKADDKIIYALPEALFLVEKNKMEIIFKNKVISSREFVRKAQKIDKKILTKFTVFKDLRERGYVVKTALKFGAEFRVYEKGARPGQKHAKWIVFTDHEAKKISWHEFCAKSRVAHSTKKSLLLAIVDEEGEVSYYEVNWIKP